MKPEAHHFSDARPSSMVLNIQSNETLQDASQECLKPAQGFSGWVLNLMAAFLFR